MKTGDIFASLSAPELAQLMQKFGYAAELDSLQDGTPVIHSSAGGRKFTLFLYKRADDNEFTSLQFFAGFRSDGMPLQFANNWNANKRFSKAIIDDEGDPLLEWDIVVHGVTEDYLRACFEIWELSLSQY